MKFFPFDLMVEALLKGICIDVVMATMEKVNIG